MWLDVHDDVFAAIVHPCLCACVSLFDPFVELNVGFRYADPLREDLCDVEILDFEPSIG